MEQSFGKVLMFSNRLRKVYRHLQKQAARQGITCFRIYDHDLPEFPFIIEQYEDKLYVSEYKRNHRLTEEEHIAWLENCTQTMASVVGVPSENIFLKIRKRKEGRQDQYQKLEEERKEFIVSEGGLKFIVNLSDYLDTGLFLDHRLTRQMVREIARGRDVLNLFCYTGSFSIYAADGGACSVVSADLSKTYLAWTERNALENRQPLGVLRFVHADVKQYLSEIGDASFDIFIMDPPTFSNSKRMEDILDIQRDHVALINECMRILKPGGVLFFSTNYTRFQLDHTRIHASAIKDITKATTPFDFAGKLQRQCFLISK
jgi:23S rRNA (cytosine1962-C5)-methyltransferase